MVIHKCPICKTVFKQKNHLDNHNKRKRPCKRVEGGDLVVAHTIETKPLSWYSEHMPHIFKFVTQDIHRNIARGEKNIIISAEVKTGKRFIAQAYSVFTTPVVGQRMAHIFVSSWVRRDDDNQRKQLDAYFQGTKSDPRVFKVNSDKSKYRCISVLQKIVDTHDIVVVHLDELDYGSGSEQHMAAVYEYCMSQEKIYLISYSASYEEATLDSMNNSINEKKPLVLSFKPPPEYRGAKWYCENNLVYEAEPFFTITDENISVSESGKALLQRARDRLYSEDPKVNRKKLIIIRQNTSFKRVKDLIDEYKIPEFVGNDELRILPQFVHSSKDLNTLPVKWDNYNWWKRQIEVERGGGKFLLILFIEQSSTRSTDWFCHPWLSAYHDYHPPETPVNTCIQANLRPVYYTNKMCDGVTVYNDEEFFPEIHGQKDVIEYVAGLKTLGNLGKRPVSSRTKVFEQLKTFGQIIRVNLTPQELAMLPLDQPLNNNTREVLTRTLLGKLKQSDRRTIDGRTLQGKRTYKNDREDRGGIYTVACNKLRNINSGPGGGVGNQVYVNRGLYFWADFALDDLEFVFEGIINKIPKGTVYITYGIADPVIADDDSSTISDYVHRVTNKSMYS